MPIGVSGPRIVSKGWEKGLEELEIGGRAKNHPDNNIVNIVQNTEKSPRDLRNLA